MLMMVQWPSALPTSFLVSITQTIPCCNFEISGGLFIVLTGYTNLSCSYFDTQLSRLGGPNFAEIPINRSRCPFITTARDGFHTHTIPAQPHYFPNRFELPKVAQMDGANYATSDEKVFKDNKPNPEFQTFAPYKVEAGVFGRQRGPKFAEVTNQAQLFYNSQSPVEQQHIIEAAQFELGRVDDRGIQERMMKRFSEIDYDFALQVAEGFGLDVPKPEKPNHGKKTRGTNVISMVDPNNDYTVQGRKIAIFVVDGFDSIQVSTMKAALMGMGVTVMLVGNRKGPAL
jgi:catalase